MNSDNWQLYLAKIKTQIERGDLPMLLVSKKAYCCTTQTLRLEKLVPLHRHSTLPELQDFVGLFRPRRLVPNFLEPSLRGLDWACMPRMFGPYMAKGGADRIQQEMSEKLSLSEINNIEIDAVLGDSSLKNLEGGSASEDLETLAGLWVSTPGGIGGFISAKGMISRLMGFLPKGVSVLVERALRDAHQQRIIPAYLESDDDADSSGEEEGAEKVAELLFGGHCNLPIQNDLATNNSQHDLLGEQENSNFNKVEEGICVPLTPQNSGTPAYAKRRPLETNPFITNETIPRSGGSLRPALNYHMTDGTREKLKSPETASTTISNITQTLGALCRAGSNSRMVTNSPDLESLQFNGDIAELASIPPESQSSSDQQTKTLKIPASSCSSGTTKRCKSQYPMEKREEKRLRKATRLNLSRKLALARPDLTNQKACAQKSSELRKEASSLSSFTVPEQVPQKTRASKSRQESHTGATQASDPNMDWERSRSLEKQISEDLQMGRKPSLPAMKFVLEKLFPSRYLT